MHDKKNGVLKPKPGEYLQPAWRNVVRFYKNTVKSPKKMFEQTFHITKTLTKLKFSINHIYSK